MIKVAFIFVLFVLPCMAVQVNKIDGLGSLRAEVQKLENELAVSQEKLTQCAEKNQNFKIAGIATVGLTGVGIATNVALSNTKKNQKAQIKMMESQIDTADIELKKLEQEFENLQQNVDEKELAKKLDATLTDTERKRIVELYNSGGDLKVIDGDISESDKVLFKKVIQAARDSQKPQN